MDTGWWFVFAVFNAAWAAVFWVGTRADHKLMQAVLDQLGRVSDEARKARHDVQQLGFVVRLQQDQINAQQRLLEQDTRAGA